jgi:hypothetical protein
MGAFGILCRLFTIAILHPVRWDSIMGYTTLLRLPFRSAQDAYFFIILGALGGTSNGKK